MHDVLSVAITVATILLAAYFNQSAINALSSEMNSLRTELNGRIDAVQREVGVVQRELAGRIDAVQREVGVVQRDMREFYAEQARHDTRISSLERTSESRS